MQRHHTFHEDAPDRPLIPSVGASFNDDRDMEAGAIHKTEIGDLVLVNGIARGGATLFFWAPKDTGGDDDLYYWGENPERPSDGMIIAEPWASARPVGDAEPVPTGKFYHGEIPEFGELMDYDAEEEAENGTDDIDDMPESRKVAAATLVAKLLESHDRRSYPVMSDPVDMDDWIVDWAEENGSAVEIWGSRELRQKIKDIVDTGGIVMPIGLDTDTAAEQGLMGPGGKHGQDGGEGLRRLADQIAQKWAKKGYQELAFEDNFDQGELLLFKPGDWRNLKDPKLIARLFPKRPSQDDLIDLGLLGKKLRSNLLLNMVRKLTRQESLAASRAATLVRRLRESPAQRQPSALQQHVDRLADMARQAGFNLTSATVNPPDDLGFNSVDLAYGDRGSAAMRLFRQFKTMVARQYPDVRLEIYPTDGIMQADLLPDGWTDPGTPNQRLARRAAGPQTESVVDVPLAQHEAAQGCRGQPGGLEWQGVQS